MNCGKEGHRTAVVILASGYSRRFSGNKLVFYVCEKPLILYATEHALSSRAEEVIVVVGDAEGPVSGVLPRGVSVALNPDPSRGLSSSIIAGLGAAPRGTCSVIFLLGDQPLVTASMLNALMEEHNLHNRQIVSYRFHGEARNPALFPRGAFDDLRKLSGDRGARALVTSGASGSRFIDIDQETVLLDIDRVEDLAVIECFIKSHLQQ